MNILTLDLATKTGWAYSNGALCPTRAGTWNLMTPKEVTAQHKVRFDRRLDARIPRLYDLIRTTHELEPLDWLVFEDVKFASTTMQAHLWASLRAAVWLAAHNLRLNVECLDTSRLKLFGTGHGSATKDMMAAWLVKKNPDDYYLVKGGVKKFDDEAILDDNAVDALHLLYWAQKTLNK